jgi:exodeoxyribonuclease VII large subunit
LKPDDSQTLTVSELTRLIKQSLEASFPRIWVQGEISNLKFHSSGHVYFSLKDEGAQLSAVLWRGRAAALAMTPQDGMKVRAFGSITVYPPRGSYQLDVVQMVPLGIGELQLAFERLKKKLAAEGLFEPSRKKALPAIPECIGIVTSPTGAALHDILSVLSRRFPLAGVVLYPARVQGIGAAEEIAEGIGAMDSFGGVDVMIVGRGGGSIEDLWAFNEEVVARAIAAARTPVVSAVGHEIDFTIADFVADLRAPTPSAAAELVVPHRRDVLETLRNSYYTITDVMEDLLRDGRQQIKGLSSSYALNRPKDLLREHMQRADELERQLAVSLAHAVQLANRHHRSLGERLEALAPRNVLRRGYVIVRKGGQVMMSSKRLQPGDRASLQFHDGEVPASIEQK